jgi:methylglyoxal synthase
MEPEKTVIEPKKKIALVAHDHKKTELIEWATYNQAVLAQHMVYATGTTGKLLEQALGFAIIKLQSGPLGAIRFK